MKDGRKYPKKFLVIAVALLFIAIVVIAKKGSDFDQLEISQDFAQSKISEKMPIEKSFKPIPFVSADMIVDNVIVDFRDDTQLKITADCKVESGVGGADIEVSIVGVPEYRNETMAFYFKPSKIEFTQFNFSQKAEENAKDAAAVSKGILETQYDSEKEGTAANKLMGFASKLGGEAAEKVVGEKLDAVLEKAKEINPKETAEKIKVAALLIVADSITSHLSKHPIKKLDGAKGTIVSLAVEDISVANNVLIIEFSLLRLTGNLLLIAMLLIAIICFVLTAPWWAVGLFVGTSIIGG
jgi:hypothetical protein